MSDGWNTTKWGEVVTLAYGKALRDYREPTSGFRVFGTNGPIGWCNTAMAPGPGVIIGRKGAYRGVHFSPAPFAVIDTAYYLRPKPGVEIDMLWAYFQLRTIDINRLDTGAAIPSLSRDVFYGIPVAVPPLGTQRRIASILGTYDDMIEINRRRVAVLEEMARGLFEEWFVRFRFPGHESVAIVDTVDGPLPKGWTYEDLGDLADIQWGDTSTTKKAYTIEGYRTYSAAGPDGFMAKYNFDRTGVVLSAIGAKCGRTWLARGQWSCIKNTMRFWARDEGVSTEYLFLALADADRWPKRGAAQPFISLGDARRIRLLKPEASISKRFGFVTSTALHLADMIQRQNANLAASRDLLLPRLISGQLSVEAAERQLEEAA